MTLRRTVFGPLAAACALTGTISANSGCSSDEGDDGELDDTTSSPTTASQGASTTLGLAAGGTSPLGDSGSGNGSDSTNTSGTPFEECAGVSLEAEGLALDMFVMFDHTASMNDPVGGDADCPLVLGSAPSVGSKWCYATHALAEYFTSPYATGHRAALQFMSIEGYVCEGGPDNAAAQAAVPMTALPVSPDHEFITALDEDAPLGGLGTRIESALHGIADYTSENVSPGRTMIGILITDGDPNGCSEDVGQLAGIIADHLDETGIRTFVIGMNGASEDNLEEMARAGGAPEHSDFCGQSASCHYWTVGNGEPEAFVSALREIQAAAILPCELGIPLPPNGEILDYGLVNITFTDDNDVANVIPAVSSAADCDPTIGGWYYDTPPPDTPSSMVLCEASCQIATNAARLDVAYGCKTVEGEPE